MMDVESYQTLKAAKEKAEDVQAMFGGIKAVLGAADDYVSCQLVKNALGSGYKECFEYHGKHLQELLGVVEHLLLEMEPMQDELVHQLAQKTFATRKELEAASATVNGAKEG